jgi:hypothetical protein
MIKGMINCHPTKHRMAGRPGRASRARRNHGLLSGSRIARMSACADQDARGCACQ